SQRQELGWLYSAGGDLFGGCPTGLGSRRVDGNPDLHAPTTFRVGFDEPMRLDDDRLMYQLEPRLGVTHGFGWIGPDATRPVDLEIDVDAEPTVGEAERVDVRQIEPRAKLAQLAAVRTAEKPIVDARGHAGEVQFHAEVERFARRQPF